MQILLRILNVGIHGPSHGLLLAGGQAKEWASINKGAVQYDRPFAELRHCRTYPSKLTISLSALMSIASYFKLFGFEVIKDKKRGISRTAGRN